MESKFKPFERLTGPWTGMSIQEGFRLMEKLSLSIGKFAFNGQGTDPDGDFVIAGTYDPITHIVQMTRRYTLAPKNPSQVGYPFQYLGKWDGMLVSGRWFMPDAPYEGGPFEMWPEREEDRKELAIELHEMAIAGPRALPEPPVRRALDPARTDDRR